MSNTNFVRYDAYKDSGVGWLGEVPAHWEAKRVKELGNLVLGKMLDNKSGSGKCLKKYLKSKNISWLTPNVSNVEEMFFSLYEISLYRIKNTDLLFSEGGEVGKTSYWSGEIDECYIQNSVHKFSTNRRNNSRYFLYLSFAAGHANYYDSIVNFVSIKHLTKEKLSRVIWLSPPIKEQTAIAAYLDTKTAHIDRRIDLLGQKAAQYGKLKQSLINETVTRGLDKSVAMKDSGIDWIGEVPSTWLLNRHKDNFTFITDRCVNSSLKKVGLENIEGKTGRFISTENEFDGNGVEFKENDILLGKLRPYLAKVYLSQFSGNAVGDIFVYRPKRNTAPKFAQYLMLSDSYIDVINSSTVGAKMPRVSSNFIANLPISRPPLPEQKTIAAYLDTKTAHIDRIVATIHTQIEKLKELRKTLINDVVTGKIKVMK